MKHFNFKNLSNFTILIVLSSLVSSCNLFEGDDDTQESSESSKKSLSFIIINESGDLVSDVIASSDTFEITSQQTDNQGRHILEVEESNASGIIKFEKQAHLPNLFYQDGILSNFSESITLKTREAITIVDPSSNTEIETTDGAGVSLIGNSLEREDGNPVGQNLELYITPIDVSDNANMGAFPGSFQGLAATDTEPGALFSFGASIIDIEDNGVPLQLIDGQTAVVTIPLYASNHIDGSAITVGDLIPFWVLNEETGIWEEESTGSVIASSLSPSGLALQATTSHFSAFNADIWGGRLSGQNGPAGGNGSGISIPPSEWCRVFMTITDMEDRQNFSLRIEQLLSAGRPVYSQPRSGIYDINSPVEFSLLQNRNARISIWDTKGRSLVQLFRCEGTDTTNLTVSFNKDPEFLNWFASVKPVFEIVSPGNGYEIVKNKIRIGNSFTGDSDDSAQVTSDIGTQFSVINGVTQEIDYLPTDPSTATLLASLENDEGDTADQVDSVNYINQMAPIINFVRVDYDETGPIAKWDVEGADTVSIYQSGTLVGITDLFADSREASLTTFASANQNILLDLVFSNQYGSSTEQISYLCADNLNSDLPPCAPPAQ